MQQKKQKVVTFSFDDGNLDDIRLVSLLNRYGLRATFNLNSGSLTQCSNWQYSEEKEVRHINYCDHPHLYDGHEIACHTYTHPHLECLDDATLYNEVALDRRILETLYGGRIRGMAYPFGTYNDRVLHALQKIGIAYSRTVISTYTFSFPRQPLTWDPTCHFRDNKLTELAEQFLNADCGTPRLFYIWGHSYELVTEEDWQAFENFCRRISGREDVWYCSNIEVIDAMEQGCFRS